MFWGVELSRPFLFVVTQKFEWSWFNPLLFSNHQDEMVKLKFIDTTNKLSRSKLILGVDKSRGAWNVFYNN